MFIVVLHLTYICTCHDFSTSPLNLKTLERDFDSHTALLVPLNSGAGQEFMTCTNVCKVQNKLVKLKLICIVESLKYRLFYLRGNNIHNFFHFRHCFHIQSIYFWIRGVLETRIITYNLKKKIILSSPVLLLQLHSSKFDS